jgi:nucleoside-diphosphate-sugar epimerase
MPINESAKARLAAEEGWLNLGSELNLSSQVFRLGGIYGPGRSAIDTVMKEGPLSKIQTMRSSRRYTSRVHVADISQALYTSIQNPSSTSAIYNIVDDDPAPRDEVFEYARKLVENKLGTQIKKNLNAEESSLTRTVNFRGEKRVSNRRMKEELGVSLIHSSYKSGLQSIIDSI